MVVLTDDRPLADYRLDEIKLDPANRTASNVEIGEVLTDGGLTLSIAEASTLTLSITDPEKALLNSALLVRWTWGDNPDRGEQHWIKRGEKVDLTLDDLRFRLKRLEKTPDRVLNLEAREWAAERLREFRGARHITRTPDGKGRARFVAMLADEAGVPWHIPEIGDPQPVQHAPELTQQAAKVQRNTRAAKGIGRASGITVKGAKASPEQLSNIQIALEEGDKQGAPERAMLAALCAGTGESGFESIPNAGGSNYTGVFQGRKDRFSAHDTQKEAHYFFKGGQGYQQGGAISLARHNPSMSPGEIADRVEGGGAGASFYGRWLPEAKKTLAAYGGATTKGGGVSIVVEKAFNFERGAKENSWDAIQRLAKEVGWRAFVRKGVLWYVSDEALRKQQPALIAEEAESGEPDNGIESIAIPSLDLGARDVTANVTIVASVGRTAMLPGMVVVLRGEGPADDVPWIVESIVRDQLWDDVATINCVRPTGKKDEPAADTATVTFGGKLLDAGKVTANSLKGLTPKQIIDTFVLPVGRKHGLRSALGGALTPANVEAANHAHGATTQDGLPSDHGGPPAHAWAVDMSNGVRTKEERACAEELAQMFGIDWHAPAGGLKNNTAHGYRFQLIHLNYPGHDNHVHFGVKREGGAANRTAAIVSNIAGGL